MPTVTHPATYPPQVLEAIDELLGDAVTVLDPFAGVGGIHQLRSSGRVTTGVELEPEWAAVSEHTIVGTALDLPFDDGSFDAVATSPAYGNRMADEYDGRDGSKRYTYRTALGRDLSPGSTAGLQWGPSYRSLHRIAWREAVRVLKPGGEFVLNVKDHVRRGRRQHVTEWHRSCLEALGLRFVEVVDVPCSGIRHGSNAESRIDFESVLLFRKDFS